MRWKGSVDEVATFLDGGKLPCLLVENKADLLDYDIAEKSPELEEFGSSNGFCGTFRTSAKTGLNINESMEYLIKNIIQRMEAMQSKGNEVFTTDRKSVALDPEKHNEVAQKRKQKDGKLYRIQLWDLAGQDKNAMVTKIFAKDAHGCVVMADATNSQTRDE